MKKIAFIYFILLIIPACIKSDLSNINTNGIIITPEYAFPIAVDTIDFTRYLPGDILLNPISDTSGYNPDSLFIYQHNFFENPFRISYLLTQPFAIDASPELNRVISATFRFRMQNAIPAKISLQAYLLDDAGQILDSIFENVFEIEGAKTDTTGQVSEPSTFHQQEVKFDSTQVSALNRLAQIQIITTVEIPKPSSFFIHYEAWQYLFLEFGAKIKLKITL
jgi:hypothetical protein